MLPILCANWKMSLSLRESKELFSQIGTALRQKISTQGPLNLWIAPPLVFLSEIHKLFVDEFLDLKPFLRLVAQDISAHEQGAYTGETSGAQAKEVGATLALIGHSERRLYHRDTLPILQEKCLRAFQAGITPILCTGELTHNKEISASLDEILQDLTPLVAFIKTHILPSYDTTNAHSPLFLLAYEPRWAIGNSSIPSIDAIDQILQGISRCVKGYFPELFIPLLYGGAVTETNSRSLLSRPAVSGLLMGRMSLNAQLMKDLILEAKV